MSESAAGFRPPVDVVAPVPEIDSSRRIPPIQSGRSRMTQPIRRRLTAITAAVVLSLNPSLSPDLVRIPQIGTVQETASLTTAYDILKREAPGKWSSLAVEIGVNGESDSLISDNPDREMEAASVNKLGIALAVFERVDKGHISLDQQLEVTKDVLAPDGITTGLGEKKTVRQVLQEMVVHSNNVAVRMLEKVLGGDTINKLLQEKGLTHTYLQKDPDSDRYFLGKTTPRDMVAFLTRLVQGDPTLLSEISSQLLLQWMQESAYTDGIRRYLTDQQRQQSYTKWGGLENLRNEVGIFIRGDGTRVIYGFFTEGIINGLRAGGPENQHPVVQAHQQLGRFIAKEPTNNQLKV